MKNTSTNASPSPGTATNTSPDPKSFLPLVVGSSVVDAMLQKHRIPRGSLLHLDSVGASHMCLLSICRAALARGERVDFVYVPSWSYPATVNVRKAVRNSIPQLGPLMATIEDFGIDRFLNPDNLTDPTALFRYLVAHTPRQLKRHLDDLLGEDNDLGSPSPDMIVVYGLDKLFDEEGLSQADIYSQLVRVHNWLNTYSARCLQTGTTLWLGRSLEFHKPQGSLFQGSLFRWVLNSLLYEHCRFGLAVDLECPRAPFQTCAMCKSPLGAAHLLEPLPLGQSHAWHISLYESNRLLDKVSVPYSTKPPLGAPIYTNEQFLDGFPFSGEPKAQKPIPSLVPRERSYSGYEMAIERMVFQSSVESQRRRSES